MPAGGMLIGKRLFASLQPPGLWRGVYYRDLQKLHAVITLYDFWVYSKKEICTSREWRVKSWGRQEPGGGRNKDSKEGT